MVPLLTEPLPPGLEAGLRRIVRELRARERRRRFPITLEVGELDEGGPGETSLALEVEPWLDDAERVDVVGALLQRLQGEHPDRRALVWLARPGTLAWHDADACWLPAVLRAGAELGRPTSFVVVVRDGWRDPRSGVSRSWKRLRQR